MSIPVRYHYAMPPPYNFVCCSGEEETCYLADETGSSLEDIAKEQ